MPLTQDVSNEENRVDGIQELSVSPLQLLFKSKASPLPYTAC